MRYFQPLLPAMRIAFRERKQRIRAGALFLVVFGFYLFLLPATYTGGRVGFVSIRFLNGKLFFFAFLFAFLLSLIFSFAAAAASQRRFAAGDPGKKSSLGGFFGSVLPPLLCCSPILPSVAAVVAGIFPATFGVSGFLQGMIATYETQIFLLMAIILGASLRRHAQSVLAAEQGICETPRRYLGNGNEQFPLRQQSR